MASLHEDFSQPQARTLYKALEAIAKQNLPASQAALLAQNALASVAAPAIVSQGYYSMGIGEDGEYELMHGGRVVGVINFWADAVRVMDGLRKRAGKVSPEQDNHISEIMAKVEEYAQAAREEDDDLTRNIGYELQRMLFVAPITMTPPMLDT